MHLPCAGGGPSCNTTPPPRPEAGSAQGRASPGQWRGGRGGRSSLGESREPRFPLPRAWGGPWGGLQGGKPGSGSAGGHSRGAGSPSETASHMAHMHACTCVRTSVDILCRRACTCGHMPTRVHAPSLVHTRAHACPCILTHANTCACTQSRTRAHVHSCTHVFARTLMPTPAHSSTHGYNALPPPPNLHPTTSSGLGVGAPPQRTPVSPPQCPQRRSHLSPYSFIVPGVHWGHTARGWGGTDGQTDRAQTSCTPSHGDPPTPEPGAGSIPESRGPAPDPRTGGDREPFANPPRPILRGSASNPCGDALGVRGGWRWGPPILVPWLAAGWVTVPGGQGGPAAPGVLANRGHP